jgi:hypothetical protein
MYDWNQIMRHINNKIDEPKTLVKTILDVMMNKNMIELKNKDEMPDVDALWDNHGYLDDSHIILALIVSLITPDHKIDFSSRCIKLNEQEKNYVKELNSFTKPTLSFKRHYEINPYVSAFDVVRNTYDKLNVNMNMNMNDLIYHCDETPYWQRNRTLLNEINDLSFSILEYNTNTANHYANKDIVDIMEDIFGEDEKEIRIDFENLVLSNNKHVYPKNNVDYNANANANQSSVFDFTILNQLISDMSVNKDD